ncbi:sodium transporter HKT1-like [Pistacia vera]|uniref:sodium transporter HKT1-like n=1 Tax=Pistacia vera TaxID=55513 RepID=UPI001262D78F|nr:sodium transporter HKT1-like [Pistacia vera]
MSTIEMEVFSHFQLIVLILLMLIGGEVFVSWLGLYISYKFPRKHFLGNRVCSDYNIDLSSLQNANFQDQIELGLAHSSHTQNQNPIVITNTNSSEDDNEKSLIDNSIKYLFYVVLGYLLVVHVGGISIVFLYISLVQNAKEVLKNKGLHTLTFSVFLIVSTFSNSGFVPTNENMMVFNKNPGLLWVLIPQVVLGNTLYPSFLRLLIWVLKKVTNQGEFEYMLKNYKEIGYRHMLSGVYSSLLGVTAFGFIFLQFVLFCASEWNSEAMDAMMMLFVVMMYLPPYTSFLPGRYRKQIQKMANSRKRERRENKCLLCSAYGNVGFTTGYSCNGIAPEVHAKTLVRNTYIFVHKNNSTAEEISPGVPRPSGLDLFGRNNHLASSLPGANGDGVEQEQPRNGVRNTYMFVHDDNSTVEEVSPGVPRPSALDLFGPKNHLAVSAAETKNKHPSTLKLFAKRKK